ncbi:MAG: hypothetical protein AAGG48_26260 [Planctomycetota bacterium]
MATATEPSAPESPVVQQGSGSRGCLYGCLAIIVGGLLLLLCAGLGGYWFIKGQIEKWTSTEPGNIPTVEYSEEQMAELQGRVDAFSEAMDEDRTPDEDLVLTAEEINALIGSNEDMRGKVFVTIENDEVSGEVSFPLDEIGFPGRYFNGSASLSVSMENGILIVTLTDASVNGEKVPEEIVKEIAKENLAKDLYNDADNAKTLRKFESVRVEGDKLILKFKRSDEEEAGSEDGEATEESGTEESGTDQSSTGESGSEESASSAESEAAESESAESESAESGAGEEATESIEASGSESAATEETESASSEEESTSSGKESGESAGEAESTEETPDSLQPAN